jgi:flagellar basal-body rod modification protein FlgD
MSINASTTMTDIQNNTNLINYMNGRANLGNEKINRQGFIQLILAQLQFQDPTNPQDSSQMLNQQLQLQQADDSTAMVNATKFSQAATMVGKVATLPDGPWDFTNNVSGIPEYDVQTGRPATVTGTIESVQFDQARGKALIKINGNYYDSDNIKDLSLPQVSSN